MKPFVNATALAAALALSGLPAVAQQTTTETETPQTQAAPGEQTISVVTSPDELEGLETEEVRIKDIEEAPRDQVQAINSSLDPASPVALELRERISEMEAVQQALADEDIEAERVIGATIEERALVLYVLPES